MRIPMLCLAAAALLSACGSQQALLARRSHSEAQQLRQYCHKAGLGIVETALAEQALQAASKRLAEGDEREAAVLSERAATLYRLALARMDLAETRAEVDSLRIGLAKDKERLQTYQEILSELRAVRAP